MRLEYFSAILQKSLGKSFAAPQDIAESNQPDSPETVMKAQSVHTQAQRKAFLGRLTLRDRLPLTLKLSHPSPARWLHTFFDFSANPYFRHAFARLTFQPPSSKDIRTSHALAARGICWIDERRNKIDRSAAAYFDLGVTGPEISDTQAAEASELLNEMARWARDRGMKELIGPLSLREFGTQAELSLAGSEAVLETLQKIGKTETRRRIALEWHPARAIGEEESLQLEKKKVVGELRFVDFDPARTPVPMIQAALGVLAQNDRLVFFDDAEWRYSLQIDNAFVRPSRKQPLSFWVEVDRKVVATCWAYQDARGRAVALWSECLAEFRASGVERWMDIELMRRAKALGFEKVRTPWVDESDERRIERFQALGATIADETSLFTTRLV